MALWLILAIVAHFLSAVTVTIDKRVVTRAAHIGKPVVLTFYIALLSGFVLVIAPYASMPNVSGFAFALLCALCFLGGLYFQFSAFKAARVSDAAPVVGAISAITTLMVATIWIDGDVTPVMVAPILLLSGGVALISRMHFARHSLRDCALAGVCFGLMFIFSKLAYTELGFVSGLFWTRLLSALLALGFLVAPAARSAILQGGRQSTIRARGLILASKVIGSASSVLVAAAVSIGSVSAVNALSGMQFIFLLLFGVIQTRVLSRRDSEGLGGKYTFLGVTSIVIGLAWLAYVH